MIRADAALTGVVREAAFFFACIERPNRVRTERSKTHRRDMENRCRLRFRAVRPADGDAKLLLRTRLRGDRMLHPFPAFAADVLLGAERPFGQHRLAPLL